MKKILLLAGVASVFAMNASAFEFNPYVSAKAKYVFARNKVEITGTVEDDIKINDDVMGFSAALGTIWPVENGNFRFEVEYTKNADAEKNIDDEKVKVKTQAVLFNVYYDFNVNFPVKPYVGAGLGWGRAEFGDEKDSSAAVQVGAGASYQVDDHISLDLGYRYISYGDFEKSERAPGVYLKGDFKPRAHELMLGLRYAF